MSIVFLLFSKSCEVLDVVENGRKIELLKSSSHHFDDSVATIRVLRPDQSVVFHFIHCVLVKKV